MLFLLPRAVDRAAERDAGHVAISCRGERITYGELARLANGCAHRLRAHGIARGDRVGIYMAKGPRTAVALYGAMKAGAAYVPLDPSAPPARTVQIAARCGMRAIVADEPRRATLARLLPELPSVTCVAGIEGGDDLDVPALPWAELDAAATDAPPDTGVIEQDVAYILHTSGSTGTPKGIVHTHRSALAWAEVAAATYGFTPADRISNHAPLHFDLSTLDYFATAVAGGTTVVVPEQFTKLPAMLSKLLEDERLTVLYCVPFALIQLALHGALESRDLGGLRWVLFGGEPFPPRHLRELMRLLPAARFVNVYGPTEVNGCTHFPIAPADVESDEPLPIGKPYANVDAIVTDADGREVPDGEVGELLIRAPTMMLGYWDDPELGERAFHRRARPGGYADVFHRTGDLVARRPDGNFRFLGRKDRQVKVRGHRVELDEVESALASHPDVEEAAAYLVAAEDGRSRIEAAVTARAAPPTPDELRAHVKCALPPYAIPELIEVVAEFPRTSTGKIDRRKLRERAEAPR